MLKQHQFYVYYDGPNVMARMGKQPAVVAKVCKTAQEAHDEVQKIVNPKNLKHDDASLGGKGFHHDAFQDAISANCEAFVKAAYQRSAGAKD